jgi:hypothetical protein
VGDFADSVDFTTYRGHPDHQSLSKHLLEPVVQTRAAVQFALSPPRAVVSVRRGMLRHVVLYRWRRDAHHLVKGLEEALRRLPAQVPCLVNYFYGADLGLAARSGA